MPARNLMQLVVGGETIETLESALDELDQLQPTSAKWAAEIIATRNELLLERDILKGIVQA